MSIVPESNPIIAAVVTALRVLGCITRTNADALLGLTTVHLTDRELVEVLARFPEPGAGQLGDVDPDDPAHAHPSWCDRAVCTHPDSVAARGLTEADVPRHLRYAHFATPRTVELDEHGEVRFTLLPWRFTDEPVSDVVQGVDVICEWSAMLLTVGMPVAPQQLPALVDAFTAVRDLVAGTTLVGEAIRDLEQFPGLDRYITSSLLPLWRRYGEMSDHEALLVLEHFTLGSEGGQR